MLSLLICIIFTTLCPRRTCWQRSVLLKTVKRCQTKSILEAKKETINNNCSSESDRCLTGNVTSLLCLRDLLMTLSALVIICQCDIITRRKTSLHDAKHHYTPPQIIFSAGNKMSSLSQQLMSNTRSSSVNLMVSSN